jgi:hypothetical protein
LYGGEQRRHADPASFPHPIGSQTLTFLDLQRHAARLSGFARRNLVGIATLATLSLLFAYKIRLMLPAATGSNLPLAIAKHDAILAALVLLALTLAAVAGARSSIVAIVADAVARCVVLATLTVYAADVFAYQFFATRLYASDLFTHARETRAIVSLLWTGARIISDASWARIVVLLTLAALVGLTTLAIARRRYELTPKGTGTTLVSGGVAAAIWLMPVPAHVFAFGDKPLYQNVVERNKDFFVDNSFSPAFKAKLLAQSTPTLFCAEGRDKRLNVLVVIVESLSSYHSKFFSGIRDWTPRLDEIAGRETALRNFYANGWTTIGGLISLLGGAFPLVPERSEFNKWGSPRLTDFMQLKSPVATELATRGYQTKFIAAGDIGFLDQDRWLRSVGFQEIISSADKRFEDVKIRGPFNSVPDGKLYEVALDEMSHSRMPFFLVVQTFWSHRPFMSPDGSTVHGEEPVIREADAQLGRLYDHLLESGYFENGLLVVTGDHRALEPLDVSEARRFGVTARARIPAIVVTRAMPLRGIQDEDFQQRDLGTSLLSVIDSRYCTDAFQGSFLAREPHAGRCIFHAQADDRDRVLVKCGTKIGTVQLAGDETRFVDGAVDDPALAIEAINLNRLRAR